MMNSRYTFFALFLISLSTFAQNAPAAGNVQSNAPVVQGSAAVENALQPGSLIYAELSKPIDSKKAKVGDSVLAKVTQAVLSHGKIAIPKNTKIIGHLTAAKASTKDQPRSQLGIAFDRAELKSGGPVDLTHVTIQALGSAVGLDQPPSNVANGTGGTDMSGGMAGQRSTGGMGGANSPMGGSPNYPSDPAASGADNYPSRSSGQNSPLNAGSSGVVGLSGVKLQPQSQGGMVTEDSRNVKLDSGTQLVLRSQ